MTKWREVKTDRWKKRLKRNVVQAMGQGKKYKTKAVKGKGAWYLPITRCQVCGQGKGQRSLRPQAKIWWQWSAGENHKSWRMWSLVPALPLNTQVSLDKSLPFPMKEFPHWWAWTAHPRSLLTSLPSQMYYDSSNAIPQYDCRGFFCYINNI